MKKKSIKLNIDHIGRIFLVFSESFIGAHFFTPFVRVVKMGGSGWFKTGLKPFGPVMV